MGCRWQYLFFVGCEGVQTISSAGDESSLMLPNRNLPNYIQHWLCFLVQEDTVLIIWQFFILIAQNCCSRQRMSAAIVTFPNSCLLSHISKDPWTKGRVTTLTFILVKQYLNNRWNLMLGEFKQSQQVHNSQTLLRVMGKLNGYPSTPNFNLRIKYSSCLVIFLPLPPLWQNRNKVKTTLFCLHLFWMCVGSKTYGLLIHFYVFEILESAALQGK